MESTPTARQRIIDAAEHLDTATQEGLSPREFFTLMDREQAVFHAALAEEYPDGYAKLLSLKIANLYVARYHYANRHSAVASAPIQLMLDPANACQLECPGCVHTGNKKIAETFDWPTALLSEDAFEAYLKLYGPFSFGATFYNYGEPFLNKKTPKMLRRAKDYLLQTSLSSNLSLPKVDTDAIVRSGLNYLYPSLDGATQETYEFYRRKGKLELCLNNIRKIVATKNELDTPTPYIEWKYLTFQHNEHEIDMAIELGKELGVDEINITTPFAVDRDDPAVQVVDSERKGRHKFSDQFGKGPLDDWSCFENVDPAIEEAFAESWLSRGEKRGALDQEANPDSSTCDWLYMNITIDAAGRIMPCCMPPIKGQNYVFGTFPSGEKEPFNTQDMQLSRMAFADRAKFEKISREELNGHTPNCAVCPLKPEMCYSLPSVLADLFYFDRKGLFAPEIFQRLTNWSIRPSTTPSAAPPRGLKSVIRFAADKVRHAFAGR